MTEGSDARLLVRRHTDGLQIEARRAASGVTVTINGQTAGSHPGLAEAVHAEPVLVLCSPNDEFWSADDEQLWEWLRPDLDADAFPGETYTITVNGVLQDIVLADYGIEPVEIASMEQEPGSGGFSAVLFRVGPWMECWYPDDTEATWGWRFDGEFDPRAESLRFFSDACEGDLGPDVDYRCEFISADELDDLP